MESWETPDEAVVREVKEETGLKVRLLGVRNHRLGDEASLVHVLTTPYVVLCERIDAPGDPHDHIDLVYLCAPDPASAGFEPVDGDGSARFFSEEEWRGLPMFPNFRALLSHVVADSAAWRLARGV